MVVGRPFNKGNKAGKGRPKLTAEQRKISTQLRKESGKLILAKYAMMSVRDLKAITEDESLTALEAFVAKTIYRAQACGDHVVLEWLFRKFGWEDESESDGHGFSIHYNVVKKDDVIGM